MLMRWEKDEGNSTSVRGGGAREDGGERMKTEEDKESTRPIEPNEATNLGAQGPGFRERASDQQPIAKEDCSQNQGEDPAVQ